MWTSPFRFTERTSSASDLLPVCNETLSWPPEIPEGASAEEAIVQPETACGAGCRLTLRGECFASAASPQLQTECGLGLYVVFSFSCFYCLTQITRISLVSLAYTARTPLESQHSNTNSIL